ncbi:MAG: helix-turn-helix domain-containing protein [Ruminococcaceae bacterium]|nr:helix-turn-helix domain-containing protein [Oscillospiraceae bacterium]
MHIVGENIRKYREQKKVSQEDMALALNVTRQTISSWETGRTEPDLDTLHRIAQYFEVTVEELIYGQRLKEPTVIRQVVERKEVKNTVETGTMLGVALAVVISYVKWNSIGWAILHGALNWVYVIYFAIRYL